MKYKQFTVILALLSGIVLGITWTINAQPTQPFVNLNPAQFSPIPGVANGSVDWGDYDNDGDPDLLIAGSAWIAPRITQIWINEAGNFSLSPATLTGIQYGEATWGDYDNDGDLDILITGSLDGSPMNGTTEIWTNQGNGTFTQLLGTAFPDLIYSSVDWGDYDGDGDLDVTLAGDATAGPDQTEIWTNNGGGNFSRLSSTTFPGAFFVRWGNYDNDADLDLLVIGNSGTRLWINQGSGVFNQLPGTTFASSTNGTWGDYDNDGDLDLVLAGQTTQIWKNQGSGVFQAVATLTAASSGDLAWGDYDNDNDLDLLLTGTQNPSPNLEFSTQLWRNNGGDQFTLVTNLAVYYFENGNVAWADYDLDGDLDFTANGFNNNGYLTELWINQGNGQFSQYRAPLLPDVAGGSVDWGDYDNDGDRDLLITGLRESLVNRTPIWTNQGGGSFSQLQGTTMPMLRDGDAKWGDYDNDGDLDFAQTGTVFDPIAPSSDAKVTQIWTNQGGGNFTLLKSVITVRTSIAWVDFDNDGDLDLSIGGDFLWINNANNFDTFIQIGQGLQPESQSHAWGDYDGDGDPDVMVISPMSSRIMSNNGNNTFNLLLGTSFQMLWDSSVQSGDYDNDNDPDLLITGQIVGTSSSKVTQIWTNQGSGSFTLLSTSMPGVSRGDGAWGDYDNDGDLDVLLMGLNSSGNPLTQIWVNQGSGNFTQLPSTPFTALFDGDAAWGDYDHDGDLDFILNGYWFRLPNGLFYTEIWTNTLDPVIPTATATITPLPPTATHTPLPPTATSTPDPNAIELLRNRSFEDDLNPADGLADFWGIRNGTGERRLCDVSVARTGTCAFEFRGSGATEDSILQQRADLTVTTLNAGDVLTLRGYARSSGAPNFRVRIIVNYADGTIQRVQARYNTANATYTELLDPVTNQPISVTMTGSNVVQVRVLLWSRNSTGRTYFDDFSLTVTNAAPSGLIPIP